MGAKIINPAGWKVSSTAFSNGVTYQASSAGLAAVNGSGTVELGVSASPGGPWYRMTASTFIAMAVMAGQYWYALGAQANAIRFTGLK